MIEERHYHASVSMGNKLFVIGGYRKTSCEVFDSFSRKFTSVHTAHLKTIAPSNFKAVCVGNKILAFCRQWDNSATKIFVYDVLNDSWSEKKNPIVNKLIGSSYIKYNSH